MTYADIDKLINRLRNNCTITDKMQRLGYLTALLDVLNCVEREFEYRQSEEEKR